MKSPTLGTRQRRTLAGAALITTLIAAAPTAFAQQGGAARSTSAPVRASTSSAAGPSMMSRTAPIAALPTNVLLFPAVVTAENGGVAPVTAATRTTQDIVTDAVRNYLDRGGVGVVVYSKWLPSVQRAVAEGLKPDEATAGPGDDPRKAQRFASTIGADEYLTVLVDNYSYNAGTRTATFNLSITRSLADGSGLGATAQKAVGTAPADIPGSRQEAYAVSSAAQVVAEQTVEALYPASAAHINPPKQVHTHQKRTVKSFLVPIVAAGAALFAPHL